MEIGKRLRTLRADKGYTQENIADMLKIPQATYSNLENNKGKLDLRLIEKIASIYDIDVLDILKEDGLTFYNQKNSGGNNGLVINQLSDKIIEQYEIRLKEKSERIEELKEEILVLRKK